jgi:signal transduction histidine kinase
MPVHKASGEFKLSSPRFRHTGVIAISLLCGTLALATASECQSITHLPSLIYGIVLWAWWGCIACCLWTLGSRKTSILQFSPLSVSLHVLLGFVLALVHLLILGAVGFTAVEWHAASTPFAVWTSLLHINRFGVEILTYGFIFGMVGIVQFHIRAQRDAMKALDLERQLSTAQLRALQMQLEPHFLFNTLNAITTLIELGRDAEALEMLAHLNAILKSTLKRTAPEKVPLSQELEIVENYLAIEQVRFADRLHIEIKVDPGALDSLVPCFLLQPIVENAIRHGIAHCEDNGVVEATARRDGNRLRLEVRDTGSRIHGHSKPGNGIGLKNTRERLAHFYHEAYDMVAQPLEAGGFEVAITIPYERS